MYLFPHAVVNFTSFSNFLFTFLALQHSSIILNRCGDLDLWLLNLEGNNSINCEKKFFHYCLYIIRWKTNTIIYKMKNISSSGSILIYIMIPLLLFSLVSEIQVTTFNIIYVHLQFILYKSKQSQCITT